MSKTKEVKFGTEEVKPKTEKVKPKTKGVKPKTEAFGDFNNDEPSIIIIELEGERE